MSSFFSDAAKWANSVSYGGWKLTSPNKYKISYLSNKGYQNTATFTFDTNFRNSFKIGFKLRF